MSHRSGNLKSWLGILGLALALAACATSRQPAEPRVVTLAAAPAAVFKPTLVMLVEQGYVIDLADPQLGRIDARPASGPGYRLRWDIEDADGGARIGVRGWSGRGPLEPYALDPLLVELTSRLGLGP